MTWLEFLLYFKIAFTAMTCVGPMLLLPGPRTARLFGVGVDAIGVVRLYGIALAALLVGYAAGVVQVRQGSFPEGVVVMGAVSNLGASGYLVASGAWRRARLFAVAFGAIGMALVSALALPAVWFRHLGGG